MKIDVVTLFPKMFDSPFGESMIKRAIEKKIVDIDYHDMRQWAWNSYGAVDDKPFGGDVGMLMRVDVIDMALKQVVGESVAKKRNGKKTKVILTSARGKRFTQAKAEEWSKLEKLVIICGHYEGVDQRVADFMVDEEISIGDYVLTGGELPAMIMIDAVTRLLPGVLGKDRSSQIESFSEKEIGGKKVRPIEFPQYTRPQEYEGMTVPEVLLSGDPKKIKEWQNTQIPLGDAASPFDKGDLKKSSTSDDNGQKNK
jgi:tRNA (guanine37-N1)-methyltransferase